MNKKVIIDNMVKELDYYASRYKNFTSPEIKEDMAQRYKQHAIAYNSLLYNLYPKKSPMVFCEHVDLYLKERAWEIDFSKK